MDPTIYTTKNYTAQSALLEADYCRVLMSATKPEYPAYVTPHVVPIPQPPTLWQRIVQRFKELMCAILRHKCVLDVTIRQEHEGGLQPWRIRCVSCGAINPFKRG